MKGSNLFIRDAPYNVLLTIEKYPEVSMVDIFHMTEVTYGHIMRCTKELETHGLINVKKVQVSKIITLTSKGKQVCMALTSVKDMMKNE